MALFWVSLLYTMIQSILKVIFMTLELHIQEYGLCDFKGKERDQITNTDFLKAKAIRIYKECFNVYTFEDICNKEMYRRIIWHKLNHNLFHNLPQFALQLYEMFESGQTVGSFKIFSVGFSFILFEKVTAEVLPLFLYRLETHSKNYPRCFILLKLFLILLSWSFIFFAMAVPFVLLFEEDRTEWLKENGIQIIDWDEQF